MILPIYIYGQPVLREVAEEIDIENYPNLDELIENMFETMHAASGIGLAAPQIGLAERIFVVDLSPLEEDIPELTDFKKVFINAEIVEEDGDKVAMEEGCLSIPGIHEEVKRPSRIRIIYDDEQGVEHDEVYTDFQARVIQHEYDHIEGIMFVDHISPLRRRMNRTKLQNMQKGVVRCDYRFKTV